MRNKKWDHLTWEEQKKLMNDLGIQTRICNKCGEEGFVAILFTNKSSPKTCKKCINKKEVARRHKRNGVNPDRHWKKTNFGIVL